MSAVGGFDGGFVVGTNDTAGYSTTIYFTPDFFSTMVVIGSDLEAIPWGLKFKDASTGWLEGTGSDTAAIFKFSGLLTSARNAFLNPESLAIMPNPSSAEVLIKLPGLVEQGDFVLMIYDAAGSLREKRTVRHDTGWTKLDASLFSNGVYLMNVISANRVIASSRWVVQH
jgi:hypothetical protein